MDALDPDYPRYAAAEFNQHFALFRPLQIKLDSFAEKLTLIVGSICALCFLTSFPKFRDDAFDGSLFKGMLYYAKVAVALGVAAIPEGLPAVITLCLSLGTGRMAKKKPG